MSNLPFITVEGPIGVGKTSLANRIAEYYRFSLLKEIVEENPFLGKFYEDIEEWSFQTEMFFLCNRYKQLTDINKSYLIKQHPVVADYHIFKNLIFAKRSLSSIEFNKYTEIYRILTEDIPVPNIVIYLHASLDTLLTRVMKRGRAIEKGLSPDYLETLAEDYEDALNVFEKENPHIPVLRFNGDKLDFVQNPEDLTYILNTISAHIKKEYKYEIT